MANEASEIHGLATNLEAAARRVQYLTARGYLSPENKEEIASIINDISVVTLRLQDFT